MARPRLQPREQCCPCHKLPVGGGPARVWCRISGRQFQADDPRLGPPYRLSAA